MCEDNPKLKKFKEKLQRAQRIRGIVVLKSLSAAGFDVKYGLSTALFTCQETLNKP